MWFVVGNTNHLNKYLGIICNSRHANKCSCQIRFTWATVANIYSHFISRITLQYWLACSACAYLTYAFTIVHQEFDMDFRNENLSR